MNSNTSVKIRICALLTCFNRKEKTLAALQALRDSTGLDDVELAVVLVDDGSTDGTADAVRATFSWVRVEQSDGSLFWCRGMHRAFEIALRDGHDYYLWLNDDTMLEADALARLMACERAVREAQQAPVIVVGSTTDPQTGRLTYGGEHRPTMLRPMRFVRIPLSEVPQRCDSMTGNIVLISAAAAQRVGNLDARFEHAMGDTDYALRANKLGVSVWVAPGSMGSCSDNPVNGTFVDMTLPLSRRWKQMMSRKGLPWRSWLVITRRHAGIIWPAHFAWPYMRVILGRLPANLRAARVSAVQDQEGFERGITSGRAFGQVKTDVATDEENERRNASGS